MLVDDDNLFLAFAKELLRGGAEIVAEAHSIEEAVDQLLLKRPKVAIVDIHLGESNGFALARQLMVRSPGIRVVMVSATDDPNYEAACIEIGAVGFLSKKLLSSGTLSALLGEA